MKSLPYILGASALAVVVFFAIRPQVEPRFYIESADNLKKEGVFFFGGNLNSFGINKKGSATARNGYVVTYGNRNGSFFFDLYKDGKFIRTLKTMW